MKYEHGPLFSGFFLWLLPHTFSSVHSTSVQCVRDFIRASSPLVSCSCCSKPMASLLLEAAASLSSLSLSLSDSISFFLAFNFARSELFSSLRRFILISSSLLVLAA